MLDRRASTFDAEPFSLAAVLPGKLLRAFPELRLKGNVAGTLCRSQKSREILLLGFDQGNALLLQAHRFVEQIAYVLLVRLIPTRHLHAKITPRIPLLREQLVHLGREAGIGLLELSELSIGKSEPLLGKLRRLCAELLLERGTPWINRRGGGLGKHHRSNEQASDAETKQAFGHRVS
jgi:hypothetical protein